MDCGLNINFTIYVRTIEMYFHMLRKLIVYNYIRKLTPSTVYTKFPPPSSHHPQSDFPPQTSPTMSASSLTFLIENAV